ALEAVSIPPTLAEQSILVELEVLMVRVAMQLMAGHVYKAAASTRKFIKSAHWLFKAKDVDTKVAKRARDKATAAPTGGVGLLQSFFFSKKPAPAPTPPPAPTPAPAPAPASARGGGGGNGSGNARSNGDAAVGRGKGARGVPPPVPPRSSRFSNGNGGGGDGSLEELNMLIEGAVPEEFAGKSWEGYLHHVDFIVALMHVGTSLIPKSLIKLIGHCLGYTPSYEKGLGLLSSCCRTKGMRRPCAAAVLELLVFREFRQTGDDGGGGGGGGGAGGGGEGGGASRVEALDTAQIALETFYASFPVVPLLSVAHAKALQTSGAYEEAYELCLMAQKVVDESVEK
ncbi:unnamed protein product, partial [Laminaria digitata]